MKTIAAISAAALLGLSASAYAQNTNSTSGGAMGSGTQTPATPGANGTGSLRPDANGQLNINPSALNEGRSSATDPDNSAGIGDMAAGETGGAGGAGGAGR